MTELLANITWTTWAVVIRVVFTFAIEAARELSEEDGVEASFCRIDWPNHP